LDFNQEYSIIGEICRNICKDKDLIDDLIQEVALIWIELSEEKKQKIKATDSFTWWVARTTKNLWSSSSSPFYSKYRKVKTQEFSDWNTPEVDEYDYTVDQDYETLMKFVNVLFPSEYNIMHSYYFKNMTIMDIVYKFDVDKNFVWNTLKRCGKSLKRKIFWDRNGLSKEETEDLIINFIGKKRLKVEERQIVLDVYNYLHGNTFNNVYDKDKILEMLKKIVSDLNL